MLQPCVTLDRETYDTLQDELTTLRQQVERYQAEAVQMRSLVESAPAAIALFDRQMRYLAVSRRWREDYKLGDRDPIGRSHSEIFPEQSERWQAIHQRCLSGAVERCAEEAISRADGTTDWLEWEVRPWHTPEGEIGGIVVLTEVITQRKQAEIALVNNEKRFRDIAANLPGAIYQFVNRNGVWKVDYISDYIWELAGIRASGVMQDLNCFFERLHPEDFESCITSVVAALENVTPWHYEGRLVKPNGEIRWWQGDSTPTRNARGEVIFCGVLLDITQRKQAEIALKQLNEDLEARVEERTAELQQSLRELADIKLALDRSAIVAITDDKGTITHANEKFSEISRYSQEELIGQNHRILNSGCHPPEFFQQMWKTISKGRIWQGEICNRAKDGTLYWVDTTIVPCSDEGGKPYQYVAIRKDISDRKAAEVALKNSEARYRLLYNSSPVMMHSIDECGQLLDANDYWLSVLGYERDEVIGRKSAEFLTEDSRQYAQTRVLPQFVETGFCQDIAYQFVKKNGETIDVLLTAIAERDELGKIARSLAVLVDVTERKQAEREQAKLLSILEASPDFIGTAAPNGQVLYFNRAARQMLGLAEDEAIHNRNLTQNHPAWANKILLEQAIPETIRSGTWIGETALLGADGREIPLSQLVIAHKSETGEVEYFSTIARDIRDRQQVEAENQKLAALVENSNDFIAFGSLEGQSLYLNPAGRKLVGLDRLDDVTSKTMLDFMLPEDREDFLQQQMPQIMQNGFDRGEFRFRHFQSGEAIAIDYNTFIIKHPATGEPLCVGTICRDIRDRKQVEAQLRENELLLRSIYERVGLGICVLDVTPSNDFRFVGWNPVIEKLTGIPSADIVGKNPEELLGESYGAAVRQNYQRCLAAGTTISYEEFLPFQGKELWWLTSLNPLRNEAGHIYRIVITTLEISDRKAAEIRLQQKTEELENTLRELQRTQTQMLHSEKMSSLGQMVAGVAHEINNPVSFIHGNLCPAEEYARDLLQLIELYQKHYPHPPEEIQAEIEAIDLEFLKQDLSKLLNSMRVGTERIREIVLSLRNFSRLDEAEFKEVNIHEGLDSTLMILQNRLKEKPEHPAIKVIKNYGQLPKIQCYPGQLNQVVMNILVNAIDALEERDKERTYTEIEQHPSCIWIQTEVAQPGWIDLRIKDNGPGIPKTVKERIFDPFFTTKGVGKGTGLGMSISYQIITEKHKGSLECFSSVGEGAEFVIQIPIRQTNADRLMGLYL